MAHSLELRMVPERVDLATGAINCRSEAVHKFRITFDKVGVGWVGVGVGGVRCVGEAVAVAALVPHHF